jgi:hypothetical protein
MTTLSSLRKQLKKLNLQREQSNLCPIEVIIRCEYKHKPTQGRTYSPDWSHLPAPSRDRFIKGPVYVKSYFDSDFPEDHHCGTINFVQYRQWWPKNHHTRAKKNDMRHTLLAVDSSLVSYYRKQCLFPRAKATVIGTVNIDNSVRLNKSFSKLVNSVK